MGNIRNAVVLFGSIRLFLFEYVFVCLLFRRFVCVFYSFDSLLPKIPETGFFVCWKKGKRLFNPDDDGDDVFWLS